MRSATQAAAAAAQANTPNPYARRLTRMMAGVSQHHFLTARKVVPHAHSNTKAGARVSTRAAVYKILERPRSSRAAFVFFSVVFVSILLSTTTYLLSTVDGFKASRAVIALEVLCNGVFSIELLLRVYAMPTLRSLLRDSAFYVDALSVRPHHVANRKTGPIRPTGQPCGLTVAPTDPFGSEPHLVFLTHTQVVPFYLDVVLFAVDGGTFGSSDESVPGVKLLRLLRLLRFLKLLRHYSGWRVLILAVDRSKKAICAPLSLPHAPRRPSHPPIPNVCLL